MEQTTLQQHIEARVRAEIMKEAIKEQVLAVGWSEDEFDKAYADALVATGVPVPSEGTRGSYAKRASTLDVVLNFFSFILLGIVTTALGTLYFQIINKYFPDALSNVDFYQSGMITSAIYYSIAALLVAYPLYYVVVRVWFKRFRQDEAKVESKLTKWITYLVLLGASVTIVGDLIIAIFTFLQGELSARFFLKAITILTIAGMIFGFYFLERKKVQYRYEISRRTFQLFGYTLTALVALGIVMGFLVAGSPATERMRRFDAQRASDLQNLAGCIQGYAQQFERLPATLQDLETSSNFSYCTVRDPETSASYEYRVVTPLHAVGTSVLEGEVEVCATYALLSSADTQSGYTSVSNKWYQHSVGYECDSETVSVSINAVTKDISIPVKLR
ncbi:MAG: hypothetical protein KBD24_03690 [Candidatus Pacebacteria bacterium]|nr:hypothetical protein [Candidatus Paceibacterota bacterium]